MNIIEHFEDIINQFHNAAAESLPKVIIMKSRKDST